MSRSRIPTYRKHKCSGQAVVTLSGRTYYLGPHGTQVSHDEYDRVVAEWLACGRRPPEEAQGPQLTVNELILAYWEFVQGYYVKEGKATSEVGHVKQALKPAQRLYGRSLAREFGPLCLKACRQVMVGAGHSRQKINQNVGRIRRMFKWGVENEYVPPSVLQGLQAVRGLQRGRTGAEEAARVLPVPGGDVEAVCATVSGTVAGMIRTQLLTGMRPGELVRMRGADIDRSGRIWIYRPERHKTEHHGHERLVFIGPRAQEVLRGFLERAGEGYLFSPRRAVQLHHARRKLARRTPRTPSQSMRPRKAKPGRSAREAYDTASYWRAVQRGCDRAGVARWHPHQLRHNAATEISREYGLEAARVVLGHRSLQVTDIYAELDRKKAAEVMGLLG